MSLSADEWEIWFTLKNIEYSAREYLNYNSGLITVDKFIRYCNIVGTDLSSLYSKYGDNHTRHIIKSVLKDIIKSEQGRL